MGKCRRISNFFNGFEQGYSLVGKVMKDRDMKDVTDAQVEEVANTRDATDAEIASAKAETEAIAAQDAQTFGEPAGDYGMGSMVQDGTRFQYLGNAYDTTPTSGQQNSARLAAMAGVLEKHGDPERALNLRTAGIQSEESKRLRGTMRELDRIGRQDIADRKEQDPRGQEAKPLERAAKNLQEINAEMRLVRRDSNLTPEEKRALLDELTIERNALIKAAVQDAEGSIKEQEHAQ